MTSLLRKETLRHCVPFVRDVRGFSRLMWWEEGRVFIGPRYEITGVGHALSLRLEVDDRLATEEEVLKDWAGLKLNKLRAEKRHCRMRVDVLHELAMLECVRNIKSHSLFFDVEKWPVEAQLVGCLIGMGVLRENIPCYLAMKEGDWSLAASHYDGPWKSVVVSMLEKA